MRDKGRLFVCLLVGLFVVCLLVCLFTCLLACLFVCLFVCLFACWFVCFYLHLGLLIVSVRMCILLSMSRYPRQLAPMACQCKNVYTFINE